MTDSQDGTKPPEATKSIVTKSHPTLASDSVRERFLVSCDALSDAELLGLVLPRGNGRQTTEIAGSLLQRNGGLAGLLRVREAQLRCPGLGRAGRTAVLAAVELSRRFAKARMPRRHLLAQVETVASYLYLRYGHRDQEVMGALYLDVRNRLIAEAELYRGTLNRAAVEPREILKKAIESSANSFILFHTHPSGDPTPSDADLAFTQRMFEAADLLGIYLTDHLIIGTGGRWESLRRRGRLSSWE